MATFKEMSDLSETESFEQLVKFGERVEALSARREDEGRVDPHSPMGRMKRDEIGRATVEQIDASVSTSLDCLETVGRVVRDAGWMPAMALTPMIRSGHESALTANWLLEHDIGDLARLERGVGAVYADYEERRKWEKSWGRPAPGPDDNWKLAADRRDDFMKKALERGLAKLDERFAVVPTRPLLGATDLFDLYESFTREDGEVFPGSVWYRTLSAYAHGKRWSVMLGEITDVDQETRTAGYRASTPMQMVLMGKAVAALSRVMVLRNGAALRRS